MILCVLVQIGRTYINVIDIKADDLQELPVREEPSNDNIVRQQSDHLEVPSSAELHHMAASVTNAASMHSFRSAGNNFFLLFK